MITTWDLFHKQTNQSTRVSGLSHMRGHDLIICRSRLKSVEGLRLKHFEWMTNVTLNFQDIGKSQRYREFHKSRRIKYAIWRCRVTITCGLHKYSHNKEEIKMNHSYQTQERFIQKCFLARSQESWPIHANLKKNEKKYDWAMLDS